MPVVNELEIVRRAYPKWKGVLEARYILWEGTAWPICGDDYAVEQLRQMYGRGCRSGWWRRVWRKFAMAQRKFEADLKAMAS